MFAAGDVNDQKGYAIELVEILTGDMCCSLLTSISFTRSLLFQGKCYDNILSVTDVAVFVTASEEFVMNAYPYSLPQKHLADDV